VKLNKKLALAVASAVLSISSSAFAAVDFLNDDAPFKTDINIAGHNGDVQLYGIIDIGYMSVNHSLPINRSLPNNYYPYSYDAAAGYSAGTAAGVGRQSNFINGGMQDSRLGLKGGLSLFDAGDAKFKMIYQLEMGLNPLNGELNNAMKSLAQNSKVNCAVPNSKSCTVFADSSLNGELFARQAWIGVDGGYLGKVSYGTQYNPFYEITGAYDPNQKADSFSPLGESGAVGGGGGLTGNSRMKNSVKYSNTIPVKQLMDGKINVAAMYQFGNNVDTDHGRGYAVQAGYENSLFGFQAAYNNFTDTVKVDLDKSNVISATNPTGIKAGLYDSQATIFTAKLTPTKWAKLSGGLEWMELSQPTDNNISYGSVFGYAIENGIASTANNSGKGIGADNGGNHQNVYFYWAGGEYDFAEHFPALSGLTLSAAYYRTKYDDLSGQDPYNSGTAGTGFAWNINTETTILDYKINKRFDVYAAATWNQFGGDFVNGKSTKKNAGASQGGDMLYKDVNAFGLGVRMKF
jgi:predicted porin